MIPEFWFFLTYKRFGNRMRKSAPTLCIVSSDVGIGGVQRKIIDCVNAIGQRKTYQDTSVHILLANRTQFSLTNQITNPSVHVLYNPFPQFPFTYFLFLMFHLLRLQPEFILAFLPSFAVQAILAKAFFFWKLSRVTISMDVVVSHSHKRGDFTERINRCIPLLFPHAQSIIVPTDHMKADLVAQYRIPSSSITVIPNWTAILPKTNNPKEVDLIYIGRFDPEKNLTFLIQAVSEIKKFKPDISVWLVGDGKEKEKLITLSEKLNLQKIITFISPSENVSKFLHKASIAVLTSVDEGMPMFLLEAMATGLPVVVKEYPGVQSLLQGSGAGFVCKTQHEFVDAVVTLCKNAQLRNAMGKRAQAHVRMRFGQRNLNNFLREVFSY